MPIFLAIPNPSGANCVEDVQKKKGDSRRPFITRLLRRRDYAAFAPGIAATRERVYAC